MPTTSEASEDPGPARVELKRLGIDTHDEVIVYLHRDSDVVRSEGFDSLARVRIDHGDEHVIATLNTVASDLLGPEEGSLSEIGFDRLGAEPGDIVDIRHPSPVKSLSAVRSKVYGNTLTRDELHAIMQDIAAGRYSNTQLASFITACAGDRLDLDETVHLTQAMIDVGQRLTWETDLVVDKHSVGGLPGNRTTPIVVPIVAAFGLTMPKTSSRAITSPAGTADTMETMAPVDLSLDEIREVVHRENGCIAWGGAVKLSPADDILIRVERALDIDSEGQMVASVLSKKAAAGSSHVVIDMPVGATAKVRSQEAADTLEGRLIAVADRIGLSLDVVRGDGSQPIGRGIGPALEARDVLAVLKRQPTAPRDLRERSVALAGSVLELSEQVDPGQGEATAERILDEGRAWEKFQAICEAQGGMRTPPEAPHTRPVRTDGAGTVVAIDNRRLARVAKLAGAPSDPAAGVDLHVRLGQEVRADEPLFEVHAETPGELAYSLAYVAEQPPIIHIQEPGGT